MEPWLANDDAKFPLRSVPLTGPVETSAEVERWEIERIMKHIVDRRTKQTRYWIKWKGWGHEHNTWEPEASIDKTAVAKYHAELQYVKNARKRRAYQRWAKKP
jgi:hypothetical protein